jgi:formylglycine-generating enzyme required for sulfatase activity
VGVDHVFQVTPFRIARYPVTNIQFKAFIDDGGYENKEWWKGISNKPACAQSSWQEDNSPRETVSWFEAVAYCRWLSQRTRTNIRLPSRLLKKALPFSLYVV